MGKEEMQLLKQRVEELKKENQEMEEREALEKELIKQQEIKRKNSVMTKAIKFIFG